MNLSNLPLTMRTIRHLRWSQVASRLARYGRRYVRRQRLPLPPQDVRTQAQVPDVPEFAHSCARGAALVDSLQRGQLPLLNQTLHLGVENCDWRLGVVTRGRLAAVTLHYHQWLYELATLCGGQGERARAARELFTRYLTSWLDRCDLTQPGATALAWNSYAIATRLGWSVRAHQELLCVDAQLPAAFMARWRESLWRQAAFLQANIEWDLRANHLLRDAVGLAWAGRFLHGDESRRWLATADKIAVAQVDEQMLADGGHFERSPFYHLEVMDDWLTLARLLPDSPSAALMERTWRRAAEYARWVSHPDGRVAQFNDGGKGGLDGGKGVRPLWPSGKGVRPLWCAAPSGPSRPKGSDPFSADPFSEAESPRGGRWFRDSGVVAWHGDPWTVFYDVGEVGPAYQPGHAHADTLTVEVSHGGNRLFVDPGTHSYDHDARRAYDRSTSAHNTVCIDQQDSSEVWHIFRVGRRARPRDVQTEIGADGLFSRASHDGYDCLSGRPRHTRTLEVRDHGALQIVDEVAGEGVHRVEGGFLLAPEWRATTVADGWHVSRDHVTLHVKLAASSALIRSIEERPLHPDYGVEQTTQRLGWSYQGDLPLQLTVKIESVTT